MLIPIIDSDIFADARYPWQSSCVLLVRQVLSKDSREWIRD